MFLRGAHLFSILYLTLSAPQEVSAQDVDAQSEDLQTAIERIGYFNVVIDGCSLVFEQTYEPVATQRGSFHQKIYLNMDSLKNFSDSEIVTVRFGEKDLYFLTYRFDLDYYKNSSDLFEFERWVSDAHPDANWPYSFPGDAPENWYEIEKELSIRVRNLTELNRRVISFDGGKIAFIPKVLDSIGSEDLQVMIDFKDQIIAYSKIQFCDVEN